MNLKLNHLVLCLPVKSRKWLACEVFDALSTPATFVYDVTDTNCWAQNGGTQRRGDFITIIF